MSRVVTQFPSRAVVVVKSDTTYLVPSTIYVGTTGDVVVEPEFGGNTITFKAVPAGGVVPVKCIRVLAATTAADMVAVS